MEYTCLRPYLNRLSFIHVFQATCLPACVATPGLPYLLPVFMSSWQFVSSFQATCDSGIDSQTLYNYSARSHPLHICMPGFPTYLISHYLYLASTHILWQQTLKVPKRENFSLSFFALSEPIWVGDLGTG
jgi:hypothetical protein